jgi:hypothetical protein
MTIMPNADCRLQQRPAGGFSDDELAGKGEEHAKAENFQRMLTADDAGRRIRPFQAGQSRGMK